MRFYFGVGGCVALAADATRQLKVRRAMSSERVRVTMASPFVGGGRVKASPAGAEYDTAVAGLWKRRAFR